MQGPILPLEPTATNKRAIERSVTHLRRPAMAFWRLRHTKLTWSGAREALSMGSAFVLGNHTNILDPAMMVAALQKPIHFLATDSAMEQRFEGLVCRHFGAIPKRKFATDMAAIRSIRKWAKLGACIGLFPEGERSWSPSLTSFVPGIERFIRLVNLPIVTTRLVNAAQVWPRWAPRPRRGHVHIEFDAPIRFDKTQSDAEILAILRKRLTIPPNAHTHLALRGKHLAKGLSNPVFCCPSCRAFNTMIERGDEIRCSRCRAGYRIDLSQTLHPTSGEAPFTLCQALERAFAHLEDIDARLVPGPGPQLTAHKVRLRQRSMGSRRDLGVGELSLYPDRVEFQGQSSLRIPMQDLQTCSLDLSRKLVLRAITGTYEAHIPHLSALLWEHLVQRYRRQHSQSARAHAPDSSLPTGMGSKAAKGG